MLPAAIAVETVTRLRRGAADLPVGGCSLQSQIGFLFAPADADIAQGDLVVLAGRMFGVDRVDVWPDVLGQGHMQAAVVPVYLPDAGQLLRVISGEPVVDEVTGEIVAGETTEVWAGACRVEGRQSDGSTPDVGQQRIGQVPFLVTVPMTVVDVKPGDLFKVTASRDLRLTLRTLTVTAVRGGSTEHVREILAFDTQD